MPEQTLPEQKKMSKSRKQPPGRPPAYANWDGEKWVLTPEAAEHAEQQLTQTRERRKQRVRATREALRQVKPYLFLRKTPTPNKLPTISPQDTLDNFSDNISNKTTRNSGEVKMRGGVMRLLTQPECPASRCDESRCNYSRCDESPCG